MISRKHATYAETQMAEPMGAFTAEEAQRLAALRRRCGDSPLCVELGLDLQRLEFARWLVQRGIVNELIEQE